MESAESGSWRIREMLEQAEQLDRSAREVREIAGSAVKHIREARGQSLRQLAAQLGVSAQFLSDIEHGRRKLTRRLVDKLLGVPKDPAA